MHKNNVKGTRINEEVKRELSIIISQKLKDPRIHSMTSVVECEVTRDLKYCKAYISVLGDDEAAKETLEGLKSSVGFVRRELARTINLRNTPEITFVLDQSIAYGVGMSKRLEDIVAKDGGSDEEDLDEEYSEDSEYEESEGYDDDEDQE